VGGRAVCLATGERAAISRADSERAHVSAKLNPRLRAVADDLRAWLNPSSSSVPPRMEAELLDVPDLHVAMFGCSP
jgi:hypothetical protein